MNVRRSRPSLLDRSSAITPISFSTSRCLSVCGRGMNSSFDTTCVGTGESTPFLRSRNHLGTHMMRQAPRTKCFADSVRQAFQPYHFASCQPGKADLHFACLVDWHFSSTYAESV